MVQFFWQQELHNYQDVFLLRKFFGKFQHHGVFHEYNFRVKTIDSVDGTLENSTSLQDHTLQKIISNGVELVSTEKYEFPSVGRNFTSAE